MTARERYNAYIAKKQAVRIGKQGVRTVVKPYTKHRFTKEKLASIRHYVENYGKCPCETCASMPKLKLPRGLLCSADVQVLYGYSKQGITKAIKEKRLSAEYVPGRFTLITLDEMERFCLTAD